MNIPQRIVSEVSKSWPSLDEKDASILCQRFEHVIGVNRSRGYQLESWQLTTSATAYGGIIETIIAVFISVNPNEDPNAEF